MNQADDNNMVVDSLDLLDSGSAMPHRGGNALPLTLKLLKLVSAIPLPCASSTSSFKSTIPNFFFFFNLLL